MTGFRWGLGSPALDLVATVADRPGARRERLVSRADLDAWLAEGGLVTGAGSTEADLAQARELREAIWALVERSITEESPRPRDRRTVNAWAARQPAYPQLGADWSYTDARPPGVPGALSAIAREAVGLLSGPDRARIRKCGRCTLHFVDRSRPGNRRWCSMEVCGNRSKAAAFRERHRVDQP